jgi:hypothetical protein
LESQEILAEGAGAVDDLEAVDIAKDGEAGRILDAGAVVRVGLEVILRVEPLTKGVCGNREAAFLVDQLPELVNLVNAAHIGVQPEHGYVPQLGADLHATEEENALLASEALELVPSPDVVMLGNAYAAEPYSFRLFDQLHGIKVGVRPALGGMDMHIDDDRHQSSGMLGTLAS